MPKPSQPFEVSSPQSYPDFEARLLRALGAIVGGEALSRALGYPTQDAFRKACKRDRLPVATFELEGRRGRYASTVDIATWLWSVRPNHALSTQPPGGAP